MRECDYDNGKSIAILQGTPEEFREWLGAPKDYDYRRLKENILKKAVEEINLKIDDMDLEIFKLAMVVKSFKLRYTIIGLYLKMNYCKKEDFLFAYLFLV